MFTTSSDAFIERNCYAPPPPAPPPTTTITFKKVKTGTAHPSAGCALRPWGEGGHCTPVPQPLPHPQKRKMQNTGLGLPACGDRLGT